MILSIMSAALLVIAYQWWNENINTENVSQYDDKSKLDSHNLDKTMDNNNFKSKIIVESDRSANIKKLDSLIGPTSSYFISNNLDTNELVKKKYS